MWRRAGGHLLERRRECFRRQRARRLLDEHGEKGGARRVDRLARRGGRSGEEQLESGASPRAVEQVPPPRRQPSEERASRGPVARLQPSHHGVHHCLPARVAVVEKRVAAPQIEPRRRVRARAASDRRVRHRVLPVHRGQRRGPVPGLRAVPRAQLDGALAPHERDLDAVAARRALAVEEGVNGHLHLRRVSRGAPGGARLLVAAGRHAARQRVEAQLLRREGDEHAPLVGGRGRQPHAHHAAAERLLALGGRVALRPEGRPSDGPTRRAAGARADQPGGPPHERELAGARGKVQRRPTEHVSQPAAEGDRRAERRCGPLLSRARALHLGSEIVGEAAPAL